MNIVHLKYAVEIADTGSINKAAENLYMNQANLSRAVKELESSLGITIFERSSKGMVPTQIGEGFINYARKILMQIDEVEAIYKNGIEIKQRFSVSAPRASYISDAFTNFSQKLDSSSPFELFYRETNALNAIKNVLQSDYNLGIIRYGENHDRYFKSMLDEKGLAYEMLAEFNPVLIMSMHHPLAQKHDTCIDDLGNYIEIAHSDTFVPSRPTSAVLKEELSSNINKHIFVFDRACQFELLCKNHETFMWVSPVPETTLSRYGLVQRQCADNPRHYKDVLIYRSDYTFSALDNLFITELCNSKREYLNK